MADKIAKLSQAIWLGSTFRPQCKYRFYNKLTETSCVLGAAYEAVTGETFAPGKENPYTLLTRRFKLPKYLCRDLASRNNNGESRESIAADLERQGL